MGMLLFFSLKLHFTHNPFYFEDKIKVRILLTPKVKKFSREQGNDIVHTSHEGAYEADFS